MNNKTDDPTFGLFIYCIFILFFLTCFCYFPCYQQLQQQQQQDDEEGEEEVQRNESSDSITRRRRRRQEVNDDNDETTDNSIEIWFTDNMNDIKEENAVDLFLTLPMSEYQLQVMSRNDPIDIENECENDVVDDTINDDTTNVHQTIHEKNNNVSKNDTTKNIQYETDLIVNNENNNYNNDNNKRESCCICLESYNNLDIITTLPICKHFFHPKCIGIWIAEECKNHCPLCKQQIFDPC
jgi:Ring finger domain